MIVISSFSCAIENEHFEVVGSHAHCKSNIMKILCNVRDVITTDQ